MMMMLMELLATGGIHAWLLVGAATTVLSCVLIVLNNWFGFFGKKGKHMMPNKKSVKSTSSSAKPSRPVQVVKCPFSSNSTFVQESAEHLPPSPLDLYGDWTNHLATRWLAAGISGQDTPGFLRAGLKRLRHFKHFLVEDYQHIRRVLDIKKKHLEDPETLAERFAMEPSSLEAQRETLELLIGYLPTRYPELYTYHKSSHSLTVHPIETTFKINEWKHCPLLLCSRIVHEDLVLVRPGEALPDAKDGTDGYYMAAACVLFSFNDVPQKLGKPVEFIHAPVPGYRKHLRTTMNVMFSKLLPEKPMWRNNWGLTKSASLDEPYSGSYQTRVANNIKTGVTEEEVKAMHLKVEYQTIRRLPRTGYLLFTVKVMKDPIVSLEEVPSKAPQCLAASIRGMSPAMRSYKGITDDATCEAVLAYLDSISGDKMD